MALEQRRQEGRCHNGYDGQRKVSTPKQRSGLDHLAEQQHGSRAGGRGSGPAPAVQHPIRLGQNGNLHKEAHRTPAYRRQRLVHFLDAHQHRRSVPRDDAAPRHRSRIFRCFAVSAQLRRLYPLRGKRGRTSRQGRNMAFAKHAPPSCAQGHSGDSKTYGFRFRWAQDYAGVRDVLYDENLFDVNVVPGMTVPSDLGAMFSLRTHNAIRAIVPEHPDKTKVEYVGERGKDVELYKVRFSRLGENLLKVDYGNGRYLSLEFFVTEPLETLYKK